MPNTPFIGRRAELAQIEKYLNDPACRLITLAGIGGTGKTRLAIQSAGQSQAFQGRACFAGLAAFTTLDDLIPAIAEAVKYPFRSPPGTTLTVSDARTQLLNYLADKQLLLVLDNFEQLVGCATFLVEILECAPQVKLLVTSRERLNLPGEWVMEVIGLEYPGKQEHDAIPQFDAVQLFVQVAERSGRFSPSENDWPAIARVCQLLEGMPLGIEMAATWTKMLSCHEIGAEIERSLDFLTASWRGMPERHQTLRLVFDYSWCTLIETEKAALCKLSLFQVGFTREAAFEVAGASLPILTALTDKSFVRRVSSGRFDTHPVLRQYAAEKLVEERESLASTRARYAAYYVEWLRHLYEKLKSSEQRSALVALQIEAQNLRLARQILLEQQAFQQIEFVLPAFLLFDVMNDQQVETREMAQWLLALEETIQNRKSAPGEIAWAGLRALTLAALKWRIPQSEHATDYLRTSLQMAEGSPDSDSKAYVFLLNSIGAGGLSPQEAVELCQRSMTIFRNIHDVWGEALSQLILADAANFGKLDANLAHQMYQASLGIFTKLQNDWGQALCYAGLTFLEHHMGNQEMAYQTGQQCLEWLIRIRNYERLLEIRHLLGEIAIILGKPAEAKQHFRCNLAYFLQLGDQAKINYYTERLSRMNIHHALG
jgi:predicted ATPase